ncbi:hypothetical protein PHYSODRAFT_333020 [Phytophthora sojae]|uniref:Uncharacterized protein n=1 Tax=Phytophthora sojae (strain P6497) TaxID=1094619 RepID=G4ZMU7_PHYSP|nr:hypothetical protein PHYSODRAFT_333020 [Phytophthora sojae]EGZ14670.1 hypothetical protein PHYSODRAFT_333020 [Phytophthora sojae]|eukprot:XP_009528419.1 hypothetical protein PHYSODRAFT_333020 [Phytophthora sojae]
MRRVAEAADGDDLIYSSDDESVSYGMKSRKQPGDGEAPSPAKSLSSISTQSKKAAIPLKRQASYSRADSGLHSTLRQRKEKQLNTFDHPHLDDLESIQDEGEDEQEIITTDPLKPIKRPKYLLVHKLVQMDFETLEKVEMMINGQAAKDGWQAARSGLEREEEDRSRCAVGVDAIVPHHGDTEAVIGGGHSFSVIARGGGRDEWMISSFEALSDAVRPEEPLRRGRAVRHGGDAADADAQAAHSERDVRQEALQETTGVTRDATVTSNHVALDGSKVNGLAAGAVGAAAAIRPAVSVTRSKRRPPPETKETVPAKAVSAVSSEVAPSRQEQELLAQLEHKVKELYVQEVRAEAGEDVK